MEARPTHHPVRPQKMKRHVAQPLPKLKQGPAENVRHSSRLRNYPSGLRQTRLALGLRRLILDSNKETVPPEMPASMTRYELIRAKPASLPRDQRVEWALRHDGIYHFFSGRETLEEAADQYSERTD